MSTVDKSLRYNDGTLCELGDRVDIGVDNLLYEPEPGVVKCLGSKKLLVEYDNQNVKPRAEWVIPSSCDMIARAM